MKTQAFDASIKLGEYGYQIISQNFQKFVEQEDAVLKDKNPEPLHQMRVGMRRLRIAVQVFHTAIVLPKTIRDASIGKMAKGLGETRDLDVLQQELKTHYQPLLQKSEQSTLDEVLKQLRQTRSESFSHLKKTLHGARYQALKQSIQAWIDHPVYTPMSAVSIVQILPDLLLPLVCQLFFHPGWLVGATVQGGAVTLIPIENAEALNQQLHTFGDLLHGLCKQMKGVRYQAEFFSAFYDASYLQRIEEFKSIQDILGQLQDQVVLRQFLESALKADLADVLPTIDQVMQQNAVAFWQHWQPLQQRYLAPDFRESVRSLLTNPTVPVPSSPQSRKKSIRSNKPATTRP
ncbi:CHAD domain-containing protein [Stenomitos frigidus]|uniref:Metal-binding protein n=1 Tax=Stenomitos frigidus ULC18 TaxID=2107698 RepID=A0A2T1EN35_9CYAN|nr:CHAD domain-containing protein [Stenomitos frigidus]PSB34125.1 metal-binding protein [Stenomitos frigidus ULC18]